MFHRVTMCDRNRLKAKTVLCDYLKSVLCHCCVLSIVSNKSSCTKPAGCCLAVCVTFSCCRRLWDPRRGGPCAVQHSSPQLMLSPTPPTATVCDGGRCQQSCLLIQLIYIMLWSLMSPHLNSGVKPPVMLLLRDDEMGSSHYTAILNMQVSSHQVGR